MAAKRGVIARFAIQGVAHLGSAACGFATTLVMVRAMGVHGFGAAALGLSVLSYAIVVVNFGAELHATQSTAHAPASLGRNLAAVMAVRASLSIPTLLVIFGLCFSKIWDGESSLAVALFSLSVIANIAYPLWAAQALERAPAIAACTFGGQFLNLVFVVAAAWLHGGVVAYALAKIASDAIVAIGLSLWIRFHLKARMERVSWHELRIFLKDSAPLGVSQVLRSLALGSDLMLLSFFVSTTLVGLYAVPFRIFALMLSISSVYFVVVLPAFVRSAAIGGDAVKHAWTRMIRLPVVLIVLGLAVVGVFARPMIGIVFGEAFVPGTAAFQILLAAMAANFVNRSYRLIMVATQRRVDDMNSTIVATIVSIGAKLALIPPFGIAGAAIGTTIGEIALAILQRRMAKRAIASLQ